MCSLFRNKFRNESFRLDGHDYSADSTYFITICTLLEIPYFGNISGGKMILSESGQIASKLWHELPEHFSFVSLDEFVVMPNHVHGIIIIESAPPVRTLHATSQEKQSQIAKGTLHATSQEQQSPIAVRTLHATSHQTIAGGTLHATSLQSPPSEQPTMPLQKTKNEFMSSISPKPGSLSTVIRSYKSAVSKNAHLIDHDFSWHPRYYERIIRSNVELNHVRDYIINNPAKWDTP
jgi:putative transposase